MILDKRKINHESHKYLNLLNYHHEIHVLREKREYQK